MQMRKVVSVLLALLLIVPVFAGGSSEKEKVAPKATSNFNATGLPILKEKQTFKIAVLQNSGLKSAKNRACVQRVENETNIQIEWIEIPQSAWTEKINIMANTGTLPDAVIGDAQLDRNYKLFAPLDDLLAKYAPAVTGILASRPDYQKALKSPDGKIHALPNGDESTHNMIPTHYWINTKWLKKLGLAMPTNVDELKKVLIAFRDQDPNGNNVKDEIPFAFEKAWNWSTSIKNFMGAFGVVEYNDHVFMKGNKVVLAAMDSGYFEALKYLSDLYKDGLLNKDVFTVSYDQFASLSGGKEIIGMFAGYNETACLGMPNSGDFEALPVLSSAVSSGIIGASMPTKSGGFAINKDCKNPEVLVRWYDYLNSSLRNALEWGRGEENFVWKIVKDEKGEHPVFLTLTADDYKTKGYKSKPEYRNAETFAGNTPAVWWLKYDQDLRYDERWPFDKKLAAVKRDLPKAVYGLPVGVAATENAEKRAVLLVDINNYLEKFVADSVINGINAAKWEKHLKTMASLKADTYLSLCQEFVDNLK